MSNLFFFVQRDLATSKAGIQVHVSDSIWEVFWQIRTLNECTAVQDSHASPTKFIERPEDEGAPEARDSGSEKAQDRLHVIRLACPRVAANNPARYHPTRNINTRQRYRIQHINLSIAYCAVVSS